jgi:hypothetical protein
MITIMMSDPGLAKEKDKEVREFKNHLKLNEKNYFMIVIKAFAK